MLSLRSTFALVGRSQVSATTTRSLSTQFATEELPNRMTLHYEPIATSHAAQDPSSIVFIHGLLGQGRNLKTFANKVCQVHEQPGYLLDLRGHGNSRLEPTMDQAHSFQTCIDDVHHTVTSELTTPTTLVGHSWGGRIALQYAAQLQQDACADSNNIENVWLLDTVPGRANDGVRRVLDTIHELQESGVAGRVGSRKELVELLQNPPYSMNRVMSQWLASSFSLQTGDFGFDMDVVEGIWPEFEQQDFEGHLLTLLQNEVPVNLVRGGRNKDWSDQIRNRLEALERDYPELFTFHELPKAGHWVHVDDLQGLVGLFEKQQQKSQR